MKRCTLYYAFFRVCCGCDTSYIVPVNIKCQASIYTVSLCRGHSWRVRLAKQVTLAPPKRSTEGSSKFKGPATSLGEIGLDIRTLSLNQSECSKSLRSVSSRIGFSRDTGIEESACKSSCRPLFFAIRRRSSKDLFCLRTYVHIKVFLNEVSLANSW